MTQQPIYLRLSQANFARVDRLLTQPFTLESRLKLATEMSHVLRLKDYIVIHNAIARGRRLVVIVE
jgi:hypothetical protein